MWAEPWNVGEGFGVLPHDLVKAKVAVCYEPLGIRQLLVSLRQLFGRLDVLSKRLDSPVLRDVDEGFRVLVHGLVKATAAVS